MRLLKKPHLKPFIKWPGGKNRELKYIIPNLPKQIKNYYEPFIGGGAVYFSINNASAYFINDKSKDLINLFQNIKDVNNNYFISTLNDINNSWKEIEILFYRNKDSLVDIFINYRKG